MPRVAYVFPPLRVPRSALRSVAFADDGARAASSADPSIDFVSALAHASSELREDGDFVVAGAPLDALVSSLEAFDEIVIDDPVAWSPWSLGAELAGRLGPRASLFDLSSRGGARESNVRIDFEAYFSFQAAIARFTDAPARLLDHAVPYAPTNDVSGDLARLSSLGARSVHLLEEPADDVLEAIASAAESLGLRVSVPLALGRNGMSHSETNVAMDAAMKRHGALGIWPLAAIDPAAASDARFLDFQWTLDRLLDASEGPKKVILNATYRCNNRCTFCATGTRTQFDGDYQRQKEILVKYRKAGVEMLDIDGGEPTLNPELSSLVRFARRIGYTKVNVTTNGRMASYEAFARELSSCGVTSLLFSIHGHTAQIHAQNVGVAEAFEQTCEGVRQIVKVAPKHVELGSNVTITKSNVRHLPEIAKLVYDLGLRWWNIQFLTPFGRATRSVCPDTEEAAAIVRGLLDEWEGRMKLQIINLPFCFLPGYERFLMGDLLKLERHMIFVNNDEVNLFDYLKERRVKKDVCGSCPRSVFCGGFYELDDVPEPTWLIKLEDLVRPMNPSIP